MNLGLSIMHRSIVPEKPETNSFLKIEDFVATNGPLKLYAGDLNASAEELGFIGLSLTQNNSRHLLCDITRDIPFPAGSVDYFQSEDVFEYIHYSILPSVINNIFQILKLGGTLRISMPNYQCRVLRDRSTLNVFGNVCFDPGGGGTRDNPGHVWFPTISLVRDLLKRSKFATEGSIDYLHYTELDGAHVLREVDHSIARVCRSPDFDHRAQNPRCPLSIIVDLKKRSSAENLCRT
jgi:predicted SAM-dependent methyltransferase